MPSRDVAVRARKGANAVFFHSDRTNLQEISSLCPKIVVMSCKKLRGGRNFVALLPRKEMATGGYSGNDKREGSKGQELKRMGFPYSPSKTVRPMLKRPPKYLSEPLRCPMASSATT